jgi:hypothetical protein
MMTREERRVERAAVLATEIARYMEAADPEGFRRRLAPLESVSDGIRRIGMGARRELLSGNPDLVVGWITSIEPRCEWCEKKAEALIREIRSFRP